MTTRIIVDSTADLVPEIKERVHIVPLTVHFGDEEYIDGVTIDHETFYNRLIESDVLPTMVWVRCRSLGTFLCNLRSANVV